MKLLMQTAARELAGKNIRVVNIVPEAIATSIKSLCSTTRRPNTPSSRKSLWAGWETPKRSPLLLSG
jgi:NAD(P)-dependent dehydrogenase (short-subunit alcohol dehydrogenase family)